MTYPLVTINVLSNQQLAQNTAQRVLYIGQKTIAGSAVTGSLVENIGSIGEEDELFGARSFLAGMIRGARQDNDIVRFDAIPLDNALGSVSASSDVTVSGNATAAGTLTYTYGSDQAVDTYTIPILNGDSASDTASKLLNAILANPKGYAGQAFVIANVVTLSLTNTGTEGNFTPSSVSITPGTGQTVVATRFASGVGDPSVTGVFDPIANIRYQNIVVQASFPTADLRSFLESRFNVDANDLSGLGFQALSETTTTFIATANALNFRTIQLINNRPIGATRNMLDVMPNILAAQVAAWRSLKLTPNDNVSDFVTAPNGLNDNIGGIHMSSFPYFNTKFAIRRLIRAEDLLSLTDIKNINAAGGIVYNNNLGNTSVVLGQAVTTYKTNAAATLDPTFKFTNYVDTALSIREFFRNNLIERYLQARLTSGNVVPRHQFANRPMIAGFLTSIYKILSGTGFVLVVNSPEADRFFKENLDITLDLAQGLAIIGMKVPIVTQLRQIIANMVVTFSTEIEPGFGA